MGFSVYSVQPLSRRYRRNEEATTAAASAGASAGAIAVAAVVVVPSESKLEPMVCKLSTVRPPDINMW